jgi:hypothetical protein
MMLKRAPLKPPVETSHGEVTSPAPMLASRGRLPAAVLRPFIVVWFWSADRPSTEKPAGSPSAPGTGVTPGIEAAIAARSPCSSEATAAFSTRRSVPLTSWLARLRPTFSRPATTLTVSSCTAVRWSVTSAKRNASSATRLTSNRFCAYPIAEKLTK